VNNILNVGLEVRRLWEKRKPDLDDIPGRLDPIRAIQCHRIGKRAGECRELGIFFKEN